MESNKDELRRVIEVSRLTDKDSTTDPKNLNARE